MPTGPVPLAVQQWVSAYARYGQSAIAGGTVPSILVPPSGPPGRFFESIDAAMRSMWMATAWIGPGLVGTTLFIPSLVPMLAAVSSQLIRSRDSDLALSLITEVLHTYTSGITVSVVTPSGATVIVSLM